jgi:hypothetical protein
MLKASKVWTSAIAVVGLLCVSRLAGAEPIPFDPANVITTGSYVANPAGDVFNLTGPVIDIHQNAGFITPKDFAATCNPCTAGDTVNLSFRNPPLDSAGFTQFVELGSGNGRIGAQTYPALTFSGSLKFNATPFLFTATDDPFVDLDTPFTFRGWVRAATTPGPYMGGSEFRLRGSGVATARFVRDGNGYRPDGKVTFDFGSASAPAPVPEPASMLLLSTGLSALGAARWRRRQRSGKVAAE